jgi:transposase
MIQACPEVATRAAWARKYHCAEPVPPRPAVTDRSCRSAHRAAYYPRSLNEPSQTGPARSLGLCPRPDRRDRRRRGIAHTIPERADQLARRAAKGSHGGRPPEFGKQVYRQRNVVERCFNPFKQWRALATRYAKRAALYRSSLLLIAALIWLR